MLGEEVWGVVAGLLCVCEEPVLEGVLSGAVLCASTHVPDSSTREISVALPFIAPPNKFLCLCDCRPRRESGKSSRLPMKANDVTVQRIFRSKQKLPEAELGREAGQEQLRGLRVRRPRAW